LQLTIRRKILFRRDYVIIYEYKKEFANVMIDDGYHVNDKFLMFYKIFIIAYKCRKS